MSSLVFPHALGDGELSDALGDGQGVGADDGRDAFDLVALGKDALLIGNFLGVLVKGNVDDLS